MTLVQLKYVIAAAEYGSISKAAERLFVSQPSMTTAIQALEKEMNVNIFLRTNKGILITKEGEMFLAYARQMLEQAEIMKERFCGESRRNPSFSVSCQHYSFAVNAFVDLIQKYDSDQYDFTIRETQTHEIIEDVAFGKSEIGVIYLSRDNREVLTKLIRKNELVFEELFTARPHVFISQMHPLANKTIITPEDLKPYPYLTFEQGEHNSFYFSEEFMDTLDSPKNIKVRDRATLFNLVIGLNGFTVSSGVIDRKLNSEYIIAKPFDMDASMNIGIIRRRYSNLSIYGEFYLEALKRHISKREIL